MVVEKRFTLIVGSINPKLYFSKIQHHVLSVCCCHCHSIEWSHHVRTRNDCNEPLWKRSHLVVFITTWTWRCSVAESSGDICVTSMRNTFWQLFFYLKPSCFRILCVVAVNAVGSVSSSSRRCTTLAIVSISPVSKDMYTTHVSSSMAVLFPRSSLTICYS